MLVSGVFTLRVGSKRQRGLRLNAITALCLCSGKSLVNICDTSGRRVRSTDLPGQRLDGRGIDRFPVNRTRIHAEACLVAPRLREGREEVRVTRVVDRSIGDIVARQETRHRVSVIDEHLHPARTVNINQI